MSGFFTRGYATSRLLSAKTCTTQLNCSSATTSTTLTLVPGCQHVLQSGATYIIEAHITGTATANGGAKATVGGVGGLTATSFTLTGSNTNAGTTNAKTTTTTLGTAVGGSTAVLTDFILLGSIVVGVGGTLQLQFAQNASHADISSVYVGSYLKITRVYP